MAGGLGGDASGTTCPPGGSSSRTFGASGPKGFGSSGSGPLPARPGWERGSVGWAPAGPGLDAGFDMVRLPQGAEVLGVSDWISTTHSFVPLTTDHGALICE